MLYSIASINEKNILQVLSKYDLIYIILTCT